MNWETAGSIGEVIGALAVVVSLIYLAVQIKQNSGIAKSVAIQHWASASALEKSAIFSDPEFATFLTKSMTNYDDLDQVEKLRFHNYVIQANNSFELLYFQWQNRTIDEMFFRGKEQSYLRFVRNPGVIHVWKRIAPHQWDTRFIEYVESHLHSTDT